MVKTKATWMQCYRLSAMIDGIFGDGAVHKKNSTSGGVYKVKLGEYRRDYEFLYGCKPLQGDG